MTNVNNEIIIEKIREVKEGILSEVLSKIEIIESKASTINSTNLKIRNVNYRLSIISHELGLDDDTVLNIFSNICEDEYRLFSEWEQENLHYVYRNYIGRTSSFYYDSNWYGDILENYHVSNVLEGKKVLNSVFDNMLLEVYNALFEDKIPAYDYFINDIDCEIEQLEILSDELDTLNAIVDEALVAYDCLKDYKTESNEYAITDIYLNYVIEEYLYGELAEKLYNDMIYKNSNKLNEIHTINCNLVKSDNNYVIEVTINNQLLFLDTSVSITSGELGNELVTLAYSQLLQLIEDNFSL